MSIFYNKEKLPETSYLPRVPYKGYNDAATTLTGKLSLHSCQAFLTSTNCNSGMLVFASNVSTHSFQGDSEGSKNFEI